MRVYWDQGVLLKVVGVIGKRSWPLGDPKEQLRLLKSAAEAKSSPPPLAPPNNSSRELPARPGSPGKRHIKDPYAANSLYALLSPSKQEAASGRDEPPRPSSPGKRHTRDPYAADSLTELLSPSKADAAVVHPYAPSTKQPAPRDYGDLFVDEDAPPTPSKAEKPVAPKAGSKVEENRIFSNGINEGQDRVPYKSNPRRFDHFEIGGDNADLEVKEMSQRGNSRHQSQWGFGDFTTPQKSTRPATVEQQRQYVYGEDEADAESPPARPHVPKPRRDAEVHFQMTDLSPDDGAGAGRIISSFQNRGQSLYRNRLFDDNGEAVPTEKEDKQRPLGVTGQNANRNKEFDSHWDMRDESPKPGKSDTENAKTIPHDRQQAMKMLESQWELYDESPQQPRPATSQRDPRRHNQPSWTHGDE